jgi:hypothetical protein
MFCHGELVRLKPAPAVSHALLSHDLARWRDRVALIGIVAPLVLPAYFELAGGLVIAALLLLWQVRGAPRVRRARGWWPWWRPSACAIWSVREFYEGTIVSKRNFYGVLPRAGVEPATPSIIGAR